MFTDETDFFVRGRHSRFARSVGERVKPCHLNQQAQHPPKKCFGDVLATKALDRSFLSREWWKVTSISKFSNEDWFQICKRLFLVVRVFFNKIFHLAPCHCSKKVKKFLSDNNIAVLKWPDNSPDLNPIENLWALIKKELQKSDCTTTSKLIGL